MEEEETGLEPRSKTTKKKKDYPATFEKCLPGILRFINLVLEQLSNS